MTPLLYRPDWDEARDRLAAWWNGEDIGRPALQLTVPLTDPVEHIEVLPKPKDWKCRYSVTSLPYKINLALRSCVNTRYLAEACPRYSSGDVGAGCLALYLGCRGIETEETMWFEPVIDDPEEFVFQYEPDNSYWRFSLDAFRETLNQSRGKFHQEFPDLIEGLDTLAAMRGTGNLMTDLLERPEWVGDGMRTLTDLYFRYYDVLYELLRDEVGGSCWWIWAPGRLIKLQCDLSAMISPGMFREYMVPLLTEMSERVSYTLYHLDGPDALHHVPALCGIPRLDMIQWQPGAGVEPPWDSRWWSMLHDLLDAGKKIMIGIDRQPGRTSYEKWNYEDVHDILDDLKREFNGQFRNFVFSAKLGTTEEAEKLISRLER